MGIFNELKERRLVQIVFSYLAAGWVVLEVLNSLVERGILPDVSYLVGLIWYVGGIPAAFLVGWHHGEKGKQRAPRSEIATIAILVVAATGFSGMTVASAIAPPVDLAASGHRLNRIAVLYFSDASSSGENQHIANGITEALIEELRAVPTLDVISRNGVIEYQGTDVSRDSIGRALQAGTLVDGTLERVGDKVSISIQLYEGTSGAPYPDARVRLPARPIEELLELRDQVVSEVALALREKLGQEVRLQESALATNMDAWVLVQRAEKAMREAEARADHDHHEAIPEFERADDLLRQAALADTLWAEPHVQRARLRFRVSQMTATDPVEAVRHIDRGVQYANAALQVDPGNAEALDARGRLLYWKHLLNVAPDAGEQRSLMDRAQSDLEDAVRKNPRLATAYSALSHMYFHESATDGLVAAQRAYEADAYLEAADAILWRLYSGNYDLQNWTRAREWCETGARRFPHDVDFLYCQLELMTSPAMAPDPERAWQIAARIDSLAPHERWDFEHIQALMTVGGILGRAASPSGAAATDTVLLDSARSVLDRARARSSRSMDLGEDLIWHEAYMRTLTDQDDEAIRLLGQVILANPSHAFGRDGEIWWGWRPLESHPGFDALRRSRHAED